MSKEDNQAQTDSEEIVEEVTEAAEAPATEEPKAEAEPTAKAEKEPASIKKEEASTPAGEGKKGKKRAEKKDEEEEKVLEEKIVTLNLRHSHLAYSRKPTPRSVKFVKKAAGRIFKSDDVKIDQRLNSILWTRGKTKSESRVAVKVQKLEGGTVRVLPATE